MRSCEHGGLEYTIAMKTMRIFALLYLSNEGDALKPLLLYSCA